jgi:hypothetical protein
MEKSQRNSKGRIEPTRTAAELAAKLGVTLAAAAPSGPTVGDADPYALIADLRQQGLLDGMWIHGGKGEGEQVPGGSSDYSLRIAQLPDDAPKPPSVRPGWLRDDMPEAATTFDWLRTWLPADLIRTAFANLWAGHGHIVDEDAGLALGKPPSRWTVTGRTPQGVLKVRRRAGG